MKILEFFEEIYWRIHVYYADRNDLKKIKHMTDFQSLMKFATGWCCSKEICPAAYEKITSLYSLNLSDYDYILSETPSNEVKSKVREKMTEIAEKTTDQDVLAIIASWYNSRAIEKLTDQNIIFNFAKNKGNRVEFRVIMVGKLIDQKVLADIAKSEDHKDVRYAAIKNLTDQKVLADIVKNEYLPNEVMIAVIKNLTDQKVLADIPRKYHGDVVCAACEKLTDQNLANIAKDELLNIETRIAATEKIANDKVFQNCLASIANTKYSRYDSGIEFVISKSTDQQLLANIAKKMSVGIELNLAAIEKLTNQKILADVLIDSIYRSAFWQHEIMEAILRKISSPVGIKSIIEISRKGSWDHRRNAAECLVYFAKNKPELIIDNWNEIASIINHQQHTDIPEKLNPNHSDNPQEDFRHCDSGGPKIFSYHKDSGFKFEFPSKSPKL